MGRAEARSREATTGDVTMSDVSIREVLMRVAEALSQRAESPELDSESVDPSQEARWLVAAVLDCSPAEWTQRRVSGERLDAGMLGRIDMALTRRLAGEPLAYATGNAAFRELVLQVDRRVLIPRPETEVVVGEALRVTAHQPGGIAIDIGTGSGAIALSLAYEGRFDRVVATDISQDALDVAQANAMRVHAARTDHAGTTPLAAPVEFRLGADLAPVGDLRARVLVSNPPYIAYDEAVALPATVRDWEPPVALFAAEQGMARYQALLSGARAVLEPDGWIVLELDARRAQQTAALARQAGFEDVQVIADLTGRERVLVARSSGPPQMDV
jgi:release factor glutamine methyltransferase